MKPSLTYKNKLADWLFIGDKLSGCEERDVASKYAPSDSYLYMTP